MKKKPRIDTNNPSIITKDMKHCYLCGSPYNIEYHHIMSNANRNKSTIYKLIVPLCKTCHQKAHADYEVMKKLRVIAQERFEIEYPELDWFTLFHRNYK